MNTSMKRVRKMVIVPEDSIERMRSEATKISVSSSSSSSSSHHVSESFEENTTQTLGDNLSRLDAEMFDILHSKKVKNINEKCQNYLQVLRGYLFFRENERNNTNDAQRETDEIDETLAPLTEEDILNGVPKAYQRKVGLLLRH